MKNILLFIIPLFLISCQKKQAVRISGSIPVAAGEMIYVERTDQGIPELVDSAKVKASGKFKFKLDFTEPEFLQMGLNANNYISLLAEPGEQIHIEFKDQFLPGEYELSGSEGSLKVKSLDEQLRQTLNKMDSLTQLYRKKMDEPDFSDKEQELNDAYDQLIKDQRNYSVRFILENLSSLVAIKALYQQFDEQTYVLYGFKDLQYMKLVSDTLQKYYPDSRHVKSLASNLETELARYNLYRISDLAGDNASNFINIKLPNPKGDTIDLSSFIGDYILLSFWASWDENSIAENLNLKKVYEKYHSRGLQVYQVSFDDEKEAWERAINFDELPWTNVSDLAYPNSMVFNLYNITRLPANYLLDKEGQIIGKDLLGKALNIKMEQLFGF